MFKTKSKSEGQPSSRQASAKDKTFTSRAFLLVGRHISFSIDENSVQMATTMHLGHRVRIIDARKEYLPRLSESPQHHTNALEASIAAYIGKFGGYRPRMSITLTGKDTAFRSFQMPALRGNELTSAIGYEVRNQIPFPADDCCFDYHRTRIFGDSNNRRANIALFASTRKKILNQLKPFVAPGITISNIFHSQEVLGHLLRRLPGFTEQDTCCLLSITRGFSEISFFEGSELKFFHSGEIGHTFWSDNDIDPAALEFFAQSLINEVRTSFDFFTGNFGNNSTPKILVYGDLSYSAELLKLLREGAAYDFEPFPTAKLDCLSTADETAASSFTACLPALAASLCQRQTANLLPQEMQQKITLRRNNRIGRLVLGTTVLGISLASLAISNSTESRITDALRLEQQVTEFEQSEAYHAYNNIKLAIAQQRAYLHQAAPLASNLWLALKDLSLKTPSPIQLHRFSYHPRQDERNITMQGTVFSKDIPPELILAEYAEDISSSPMWEDVQIVRHSKRIFHDGFEIQFVIEMRGKA